MKKPAKRTPTEDRHARFVAEFLVDLNATKAYQRVYGGSEKSARTQGSRLLAHVDVSAKIAAGKAAQLKRADLSAARVLEEIRRLAFVNAVDVLRCKTVEDLEALPLEVQAAISSFEVIDSNIAGVKDGLTERVRRVKVMNKAQALEMLAKHFKLLTEVIETDSLEALFARLDRGRARNAQRQGRDAK